ncbi:hypothetical protein SCLCIDRAFT_7092 [Scleroderma citrinum Foug A]|uniref:Uncharacterized protein n=1 Tax=Scleroderma citrinum Foug A TaxID=1036808 RepID=A0A0C3E7X5_9AGAM|nr:hypothetical protein SCLCIDRAFT_7092 [Scleroderma citrinum Foug A]
MPPSSSDSPIGLLRGGAVQSGESKYFLRRRSQGQGDGKAGMNTPETAERNQMRTKTTYHVCNADAGLRQTASLVTEEVGNPNRKVVSTHLSALQFWAKAMINKQSKTFKRPCLYRDFPTEVQAMDGSLDRLRPHTLDWHAKGTFSQRHSAHVVRSQRFLQSFKAKKTLEGTVQQVQ